MTGPLAEAWATPASRRKILLGELPQRLDLGLAHSGVQGPRGWAPWKMLINIRRCCGTFPLSADEINYIYIYLLFLIAFFNDLWYFTISPGMPSKISYQWAFQRFSYYVQKKRVLNLDDFNRVWIYLWKRMESFALSSALEIISSVSAPYEVSSLSLVLFKQPGHIADYCKMSNDNN